MDVKKWGSVSPATGWWAVFREHEESTSLPISLWGVDEGGEVWGIDKTTGPTRVVECLPGFVGYEYRPPFQGYRPHTPPAPRPPKSPPKERNKISREQLVGLFGGEAELSRPELLRRLIERAGLKSSTAYRVISTDGYVLARGWIETTPNGYRLIL